MKYGADLPNDIMIAASFVPQNLVDTVKKAFVEKGDALMAGVLQGEDNKKYQGGHFIAEVNDKDYDGVRAMYATVGVPEFSKFLGE